jgi:hypothetical protein
VFIPLDESGMMPSALLKPERESASAGEQFD